jgi:hypothetical protein
MRRKATAGSHNASTYLSHTYEIIHPKHNATDKMFGSWDGQQIAHLRYIHIVPNMSK